MPDLQFDVNAVNLFSKLLITALSTQVSIKKKASQFSISLKNEAFKGNVSLNLKDNKLSAEADIQLDKLGNYLQLSEQQSGYLNNHLLLSYQSNLNEWQTGSFKADWQGAIPSFSQQADLSVQGQINLLKELITITSLAANAKEIVMPFSEQQDWQTSYIKIKNSDAVVLSVGQKRIETLPVQIRVGSSQLLTKVERGANKRIRIDKQKLPALYIESSVVGNEEQLLVDWKLTALNQKLAGEVQLTPEWLTFKVQENSLNIKSLVESGKQYVEQLEQLTIEKGTVKVNVLMQYHRLKHTLKLESELVANDIAGKNESIFFDGLAFESRLHYLFDEQSKLSIVEDKQQLNIANLFVGIPIQSIQIDAKAEGGKPVIQHFKARLLGGRVDFDDFKVYAPSETILNVSGISLADVIKYSAYPEITAKGIIDAMLPLKLTQAGPEITAGIIFARAPGGYIKVPENTVIKAMGSGNPAFTLTMQILSNFQFDTLLGKLGYTSDGESDLKVEIKGISPTVSGAQPVHFNYSHNENILKLLKSLRFNDELVRDIKERY